VSTMCPHGLTPSSCLICQTLGMGSEPETEVKTKGRGRAPRDLPDISAPSPAGPSAVRPDAVYQEGRHIRRPGSVGTHFALLVAAIAVIGLVTWIVAGVVFAVLHLIEIVLVAGVAAWAGYRLGHYRGRRKGP
jgi:hypothetical protein